MKKAASPTGSSDGNTAVKKATINKLDKLFDTQVKSGMREEVVKNWLTSATLTSGKIKKIAKTYKLHSNYQEATKDTSRKAFLNALIKKPE